MSEDDRLDRVIRELRPVKPFRWKYKGFRSEDEALVLVPFGHLQMILDELDRYRGRK